MSAMYLRMAWADAPFLPFDALMAAMTMSIVLGRFFNIVWEVELDLGGGDLEVGCGDLESFCDDLEL